MSISIDNYAGSLMDAYSNLAVNDKSDSAKELESKLNGDLSKATDEELMDVCKQFEAYFTEQMFKAMHKMVPESEESDKASVQLMDYARESLTRQYADSSAENGGLGLAQTLYEQMKRNYNISE